MKNTKFRNIKIIGLIKNTGCNQNSVNIYNLSAVGTSGQFESHHRVLPDRVSGVLSFVVEEDICGDFHCPLSSPFNVVSILTSEIDMGKIFLEYSMGSNPGWDIIMFDDLALDNIKNRKTLTNECN